jgi:hypothetical protein
LVSLWFELRVEPEFVHQPIIQKMQPGV